VISIRVDYGLAYEALMALAIAESTVPSTRFANGPALRRRYSRLAVALRRQISTLDAGEGEGWGALIGIIPTAPPPRGVAELRQRIKAISPLQLKLTMLGYRDRSFREQVGDELFRDAAAGGKRAATQFRTRAPRARQGLEVGPLIDVAPLEVSRRIDMILEDLPPELYTVDRKTPQVLARAAAQAAGLVRTLPPEAVVTKLTRGIVASPARNVWLVPTAIYKPWTLILDHEATRFFCFPVAEWEPGPGEPDPDLVALYRALGDANRLRLLKRLAVGRATFGELSRDLGLARSTLHQHALILRTAGLIRLHLDTGLELNPERPSLDRPLEDYLSK
jgi:DNA-binding transcriptional ArsR family regulator